MSRQGPGRPEHEPTEETRRRVSVAAGGGMSHDEIAIALGIARGTLEKHYDVELSEGAYQRRIEVLEAMHTAAVDKGNVTAQRAYLERIPQAAPVPAPEPDPAKPEKRGKKEQAELDARTAAAGTPWEDVLPRPGSTRLQ